MNTQECISKEKQYLAPNYNPLDVVITRGEGIWVEDVEGKKYMDFLAAYSALNQGYCHPKIKQAMLDQIERVTLTSRAFRNDQLPILAEKLCTVLGYEMMLPMNSGAEAVETALKAARKWGYKYKNVPEGQANIIAMSNNFHGRTITIVSFSTEDDYRSGFGPFTSGFTVIPYGDLDALEKAIGPNTVAVLMEPIQGEAGIIIPPEGTLKKVREICDRNRMLMIADEIQSGLGRTGRMLACEWENVKPDMVCLGKAISGGFYPVSAVVGSREVMTTFEPGQHGSTFGGNPLACAVAVAAVEVLVEEKLCERAEELGKVAMDILAPLRDNPKVLEVRGRGLWVGIELKPEAGGARQYCLKLMEKGLLAKDTHHHTIRLAPPLVITREELVAGLKLVLEVLA